MSQTTNKVNQVGQENNDSTIPWDINTQEWSLRNISFSDPLKNFPSAELNKSYAQWGRINSPSNFIKKSL